MHDHEGHQRNTVEPCEEVVYTAEELAATKKLHPSTIRRMFADEPGVIRFGREASANRRQYFTLRIPASVARRVFEAMTVRKSAMEHGISGILQFPEGRGALPDSCA